MVHPTLVHINATYGETSTNKFTSRDIHGNEMFPHSRYKNIFIRRFSIYQETEEIQRLLDKALDSIGDSCAKDICQIADLKNASHGLYVSFTGKLSYDDGLEDKYYIEFQLARKALRCNGGLLPANAPEDGNNKVYNYSYLKHLIDLSTDEKTMFIPAPRGKNQLATGPHEGKKGFIIQFSSYLMHIAERKNISVVLDGNQKCIM